MMLGLLSFSVALVASLSLTIPVRQLALRVGMVDLPGPRKVHLQPIPLLGGLAIYSGVLLGMLVSMGGQAVTQILGILAGATLVILVGTLDDRGLLHHQIKLFVGMPVAGLILLASGIRAQVFSVYFHGSCGRSGGRCAHGLLGHRHNGVLQHLRLHGRPLRRGRCHGLSVLCHFRHQLSGQVLVSVLAAAVMGAALGFLRWNFNPAQIFMGDGGAMFLGFLMATLALKLRLAGASRAAGWLVPILVLGVPIFDTLLVSISPLAPRLAPVRLAGQGSHRPSSGELRFGDSPRRIGDVRAGRRVRHPRALRKSPRVLGRPVESCAVGCRRDRAGGCGSCWRRPPTSANRQVKPAAGFFPSCVLSASPTYCVPSSRLPPCLIRTFRYTAPSDCFPRR